MAARSDPTGVLDAQWLGGVNSFSDPRLGNGQVQRGWNVTLRSGVVSTRPGLGFVHRLPDGNLQGVTHFEPRRGPAQLVVVVDGAVYVSAFPFRAWKLVGSLMYQFARRMYFCRAEQSVRRNSDDSLTLLPAPLPVLVIQDGISPPLVWNGTVAERQTGHDVIPQGTVMLWSGFRLWVARDNWLFASDFANPYSFVERYYLGGADSLLAPGRITALAETEGTGEPQMLVYTETRTLVVQSNILDRTQWISTPNFSRVIFPNIGCTSHRSVVSHFGQLWWWTANGLTSFNLAASAHLSSAFPLVDSAMTDSKRAVTPSDGDVAAIPFENYLLVSVPHGGRYNRHTWALDESIAGGPQPAAGWCGVWHGFQPVEWTRLVIDGQERVFCGVTDGTRNQVLELSHRFDTDAGRDIECGVELRVESFGTPASKIVRYAELAFSEIAGDVDLRVDWRGMLRGRYKVCLSGRFHAPRGSIRGDKTIDASVPDAFFATRGQTRRVRTSEITGTPRDAYINCVEDPRAEERDNGFAFIVRWNGHAALREFRTFAVPESETNVGTGAAVEADDLFVRFDGASGGSLEFTESADAVVFTATAGATGTAGTVTATATRTARSAVSSAAASKAAGQAAAAQVATTLREIGPFNYGAMPS